MIHNQLAYAAELQSGTAIAAGLGREEDGVTRLGETLGPSIDPWSQPEWAYLRGERLGAMRAASTAVAAEFGIVAIGNAAGSGAIVVVESVAFASSGVCSANLEVLADSIIAATLSAQAFAASGRDRRFGSTAGRVFQRAGTDPTNTFGIQLEQRGVTAANSFVDFVQGLPCILKPGDDLIVICQSVNLVVSANFRWRERKAFGGELPA